MKQLRLLGLMLLAIFALGSTVVASASASERGVLVLKEVASIEATGENLANKGTLTAATNTFTCNKLSVAKLVLTEPGKEHFNLGKDINLQFSECKSGGVACSSEGDAKEIILVLVDAHLVNLLDKAGGKLVPGAFALVLSPELTATGLLILCGVVHLTIRGAFPLLVKVTSLTEKVSAFSLEAMSVICDTENEKVCTEILEKEPFQANFGAGFVAATEVTEAYPMKLTTAVLWDD
jgi:hypothetical protein